MSKHNIGDIVDIESVYIGNYEIKGTARKHVSDAKSIQIVEVPDKGKPVAIIEEWDDDTENKNNLLNGHL